jgi:hypothetical protein
MTDLLMTCVAPVFNIFLLPGGFPPRCFAHKKYDGWIQLQDKILCSTRHL